MSFDINYFNSYIGAVKLDKSSARREIKTVFDELEQILSPLGSTEILSRHDDHLYFFPDSSPTECVHVQTYPGMRLDHGKVQTVIRLMDRQRREELKHDSREPGNEHAAVKKMILPTDYPRQVNITASSTVFADQILSPFSNPVTRNDETLEAKLMEKGIPEDKLSAVMEFIGKGFDPERATLYSDITLSDLVLNYRDPVNNKRMFVKVSADKNQLQREFSYLQAVNSIPILKPTVVKPNSLIQGNFYDALVTFGAEHTQELCSTEELKHYHSLKKRVLKNIDTTLSPTQLTDIFNTALAHVHVDQGFNQQTLSYTPVAEFVRITYLSKKDDQVQTFKSAYEESAEILRNEEPISKDIVNLDHSPQNIFLPGDNCVRGDFGLVSNSALELGLGSMFLYDVDESIKAYAEIRSQLQDWTVNQAELSNRVKHASFAKSVRKAAFATSKNQNPESFLKQAQHYQNLLS